MFVNVFVIFIKVFVGLILIFIVMGSEWCGGQQLLEHNVVSELGNQLPNDKRYLFFRGKTNRYNDLSVMNIDSNVYVFSLKTQRHKQMQVKLTVLNQIPHRVVHPNYKLNITNNILIDPMDQCFQNTLILVKNQTTGMQYHMRIIPFIGYNSSIFKKALQQLWIYQNKISKQYKHLFLTLQDAFVYGINPDQQALVILFEKVDADLLHIAQYRRQANWPWKEQEKIKIVQNLFQSIVKLKQLNIIHRNISPSNLFLIQKLNRFVIGNFSSARQLFHTDESDLITVYGVEALNQGKISQLISNKADMGIFNINQTIYSNIRVFIQYIQSLSITNRNPHFKSNHLQNIYNKVKSHASIQQILDYLKKIDIQMRFRGINLFEDKIIAKMCQPLLFQKNRTISEEYQFKTYQILGYYKQFSDMAHKIIEKNNSLDKPNNNAYIFKDLGNFYEKNGTGGTEYLLNACILFCKQTQKYIEYKLYKQAGQHLTQAQDLYVQLSNISDFSLNLIEIKRLRSLLKVFDDDKGQTNDKNEAVALINKAMTLASQKNLSIEKQMKLILTCGIINREAKNMNLAEERFNNGVLICQNAGAFENILSCQLMKSNFLYQLGVLYLKKINQMHNPHRSSNDQTYILYGYKQRCQLNLRHALQIRMQKQKNPFHIAQCHYALGSYYLLINNYIQAKNQYKKCLIKMKLLNEKVSPELVVQMNYDLGSAFYKLKQFDSAQFYYKEAISVLEYTQYDNDWKVIIQGNLALAKIRSGQKSEGFKQLQNVKQIIRNKKSFDTYDYLFFTTEQQKIRQEFY